MTNLALLAAGVGVLLPLLISVIQQESWSEPVRAIVGVAVCTAAAIVTVAAEGHLDLHHLGTTLTFVYGAAQVSYHSFHKPVGTSPTIEHHTSIRTIKDRKHRKVVKHHHGHQ